MLRFLAPLAAATLLAAPLAGQAPVAPAPSAPLKVDDETRAGLTCAAAFAIVASEQRRGLPSALQFPPLAERGREYFVRVGARAMDSAKIPREAVRTLLEGEVARLQELAKTSDDPETAVNGVMTPCLARLEAVVPPLPRPSLAQCAAIMALAYEEVHAREGLSASARDLKTLASVLETREREALAAKGVGGNDVDRRVAEARDAMLKEAMETAAGVDKYDLQACYDFARPEDKSHY